VLKRFIIARFDDWMFVLHTWALNSHHQQDETAWREQPIQVTECVFESVSLLPTSIKTHTLLNAGRIGSRSPRLVVIQEDDVGGACGATLVDADVTEAISNDWGVSNRASKMTGRNFFFFSFFRFF
jgi:hypothetical protein